MIEDVALETNISLSEPAVLIGDGTMPYPGNSRVLDAPEVAETVKETEVGKTKPLLGDAAVPAVSGLLDVAVCSGAGDIEIEGKVKDDCDKEKMMIDDTEETGVSAGEVADTVGLLGGATHLVQSVDVEVRVSVEMVVVTSLNDVLPEVTRLVIGQVVNVV